MIEFLETLGPAGRFFATVAALCMLVGLGFVGSALWDVWKFQRVARAARDEENRRRAEGLAASTGKEARH